ncbi:MAG: stage III sporulation protein AF [Candidatus Choladocola sp.]|nr:stage III sporulation protein AF [Candidatus Choladocola sp.]
MNEWLKMLAGSLCVITILLHLVPDGKFEKYVKFYAGLLFFLIAAGPVLEFFAGEGKLERLLELEFLREEQYDLKTAVEGMADLKNDQIRSYYQQELLRQVEGILAAYGLTASGVSLDFDEKEGYTVTGVSIVLDLPEDENITEEAKKEISGLFLIENNRVRINERGPR